MRIKLIWLSSLSGFIICSDQLTKMLVHTRFRLGESIPVIEDFFNITYVRNPGAAFGFLAGLTEDIRNAFFLSFPPLVILLVLWFLREAKEKDRLQIIGYSLIFSGAIGNYIDRLRFRYVIDFLDFHYKGQWSWPAFNIADSAIVCGIVLLGLDSLLEILRNRQKASV